MPTRYDVSAIPLQGGYVAKQCPVRAQNDTIHPGETTRPDLFTARIFAYGNTFEAEIVAEILRLNPQCIIGRSVEGMRLPADHRRRECTEGPSVVDRIPLGC
jgi:hypothetical protein